MRRAIWLSALLLGCPESATEGPVQAAPDRSPGDMATQDAAAEDAALDQALPDATLDMRVADMAPDAAADMRPADMRLDAAADMTPADMAVDLAAPDATIDAALDMAPPDMAPPDMAPPDMTPPDMGPRPERDCFDDLDNDADGRIDCADPDCRFEAACFDAPEDCDNGVDDNGDLWADCDDVLCLTECPPVDRPPIEVPEIQARFDRECLMCHSGPQPDALLDLTDFVVTSVGVRSSQVDGLRIAPGDRQASYLWRKMAYTFRTFEGGGGDAMPPAAPLDADFVDRFGDWIDRQ